SPSDGAHHRDEWSRSNTAGSSSAGQTPISKRVGLSSSPQTRSPAPSACLPWVPCVCAALPPVPSALSASATCHFSSANGSAPISSTHAWAPSTKYELSGSDELTIRENTTSTRTLSRRAHADG